MKICAAEESLTAEGSPVAKSRLAARGEFAPTDRTQFELGEVLRTTTLGQEVWICLRNPAAKQCDVQRSRHSWTLPSKEVLVPQPQEQSCFGSL